MKPPAIPVVVVLALVLAGCASSPPAASVTAVALQPGDQPLDVGASLTLTATVTVTGNAGTAVAWTASCGTVSETAAGTATYTAPTVPQTCTVTATSTTDGARSASVTFTIVASDPVALAVATQPAAAASGALLTSQPVVAIVDAFGNPTASNAEVTVTIESTALGLLDGTTTIGAVAGVATFTDLRLVGNAGSYVLRFSATDLTVADAQPITLTAGLASRNSYVMADPSALVADGVGTSTIRVVLVDAEGNLLTTGGDIVEVDVDTGSVGPVTDLGNGNYTAVYTAGTTAGPVDVTTNVTTYTGGFDLMPPGDPVITLFPGPATPGASTVAADPAQLVQDGASASLLTVRLYDAYGNELPYSGGVVDFEAPAAGAIGAVTDRNDGTYTATYTASAAPIGSVGGSSISVVIVPRLNAAAFDAGVTLALMHPCPADRIVGVGGVCVSPP